MGTCWESEHFQSGGFAPRGFSPAGLSVTPAVKREESRPFFISQQNTFTDFSLSEPSVLTLFEAQVTPVLAHSLTTWGQTKPQPLLARVCTSRLHRLQPTAPQPPSLLTPQHGGAPPAARSRGLVPSAGATPPKTTASEPLRGPALPLASGAVAGPALQLAAGEGGPAHSRPPAFGPPRVAPLSPANEMRRGGRGSDPVTDKCGEANGKRQLTGRGPIGGDAGESEAPERGGVGVAERARALNQVRGGVDGRERRPIAERSRAAPPLPPPKLPESQVAPGCAAAAAGGGGRGGGGCGGPAARAASPHPFPRWAEALRAGPRRRHLLPGGAGPHEQ